MSKIKVLKHPDVIYQNTRMSYIRTSGCYLLKHPDVFRHNL
ncbi:hypothetical protein M072_0238 [Bacteroides fragilis str. DS-208]|nr:hypothetical protein M072_0238 [Bacteroides fragilis str. DS-208]